MIHLEVHDEDDLQETLKMVDEKLERPGRLLKAWAMGWTRRVKQSMDAVGSGNPEPADPGEPPNVHSGSYVRTIEYDTRANGVELGSTDIRARLLDQGGTVKAKDGMLAIPIAKESYGERPKDFAGLTIGPRYKRDGMQKAILGRSKGGGEFEGLFVLQPEATIHPHPHIEITQEDEERLMETFEATVEE